MNRKGNRNRMETNWNRWRARTLTLEAALAQRFEHCTDVISGQSEVERNLWSWGALALGCTLQALFRFDASFLHLLYLPLWLGAWILDRRRAAMLAIAASVWIYFAPMAFASNPVLHSPSGKLATALMYVLTTWLMGRLRDVHSRERRRARVDSLTGCLNTAGFYEAAERLLEESKVDYRPFALIYADLDDFKRLNDTLGHLEADRALKVFGKLLQVHTRSHDLVARVGGDEFVVLLTGIGPDMAFSAAERLQIRIQNELRLRGFDISASVGCIAFNESPESVQAAVQLADQMMYAAKNDGKAKTVTGVWPPHSIADSVRLGAIYAN